MVNKLISMLIISTMLLQMPLSYAEDGNDTIISNDPALEWRTARHDSRNTGLSIGIGNIINPSVIWDTPSEVLPKSILISDVDNDGKSEIVIADSGLYIINSTTGVMVWTIDNNIKLSTPAIGDVDDDLDLEIVTQTNTGYLNIYNPRLKSLEWSVFLNLSSTFPSTPSLGGLDDDGSLDIIVRSTNCSNVIAISAKKKAILWTSISQPSSYDCISIPAIGDINNDQKNEVIIGFRALSNMGTEIWNLATIIPVDYSASAIADVNNDHIMDVVLLSGEFNTMLYVITGSNGLIQRKCIITNESIYNRLEDVGPAIGDVDNDGTLEIVLGSYAAKSIYVMDSTTCTLKWKYNGESGFVRSPTLGDIDGDSTLDVLVTSTTGSLLVLNGRNGSLKWEFKGKEPCRSPPSLGDLDSDGQIEIVIAANSLYMIDEKLNSSNESFLIENAILIMIIAIIAVSFTLFAVLFRRRKGGKIKRKNEL